jgi:hypothetical protein
MVQYAGPGSRWTYRGKIDLIRSKHQWKKKKKNTLHTKVASVNRSYYLDCTWQENIEDLRTNLGGSNQSVTHQGRLQKHLCHSSTIFIKYHWFGLRSSSQTSSDLSQVWRPTRDSYQYIGFVRSGTPLNGHLRRSRKSYLISSSPQWTNRFFTTFHLLHHEAPTPCHMWCRSFRRRHFLGQTFRRFCNRFRSLVKWPVEVSLDLRSNSQYTCEL